MTAAPRFATRPTPGALHDAAAMQRLSVPLRRPLMPWQQLVSRVATERRLDDPRRLRYREVRVSVPRQAGKTALDHVKNVHRTMRDPNRQAFYTAQTGKDARARWHDLRQLVEASPFARFVIDGNHYGGEIRLAAGETALRWPNRSFISPFAPTPASLHGYSPDDVDQDEVWEYDEVQAAALDGAIGPAMITKSGGQRWLFSTMGDADSTYWHRLVDEGRAATEDPEAEIAYFEWSADPGRDLYDPDHLADFHPAVGHTVDIVDLQAEARRQPEGTWQRAYCNLRTRTRESIVDAATFAALADDTLTIAGRGAALAYDVAHDNSQSTIMLAAPMPADVDDDGDRVGVVTVRSAPGVAWLADSVAELADRWRCSINADDGGPTREVTAELRRRGREVKTTGGAEYATACGAWLRRCRNSRLVTDGSAVLADAMQALALRPVGDAVAFSRSRSAGPIDAAVAGAVAMRAALLDPPPAPAPMVAFG